jgi:uncharacterized membrane protein
MSYSLSQSDLHSPHSGHVNVGEKERFWSAAAGGALGACGLRRAGSIPGLLMLAAGGALVHRAVTGRCALYDNLGIDTASHSGARPEEYFERGIHLEESVTIDKPAAELFEFWRNFENLPRFMHNLESVQIHDQTRSHWIAKGPAGGRVEWEAEIINEVPGELIAWRTIGSNQVENAGSVRFVPSRSGAGARGTEVKIVMDYLPPAGRLGRALAVILGKDPRQQVKNDLRRFKQFMETGEIATTRGQPAGAGRNDDESPTGHRMTRILKTHERAAASGKRRGAPEVVQKSSEDSFPASDPPGWGSTNA